MCCPAWIAPAKLVLIGLEALIHVLPGRAEPHGGIYLSIYIYLYIYDLCI